MVSFYLIGQPFCLSCRQHGNLHHGLLTTFEGTQHYLQSDVKVLHFTR